jgi:hypothetical protein
MKMLIRAFMSSNHHSPEKMHRLKDVGISGCVKMMMKFEFIGNNDTAGFPITSKQLSILGALLQETLAQGGVTGVFGPLVLILAGTPTLSAAASTIYARFEREKEPLMVVRSGCLADLYLCHVRRSCSTVLGTRHFTHSRVS